MESVREIIIHGDYFAEFYDELAQNVRRKINFVLSVVRTEQNIPAKFFRSIETVAGLFEVRVEADGNIYRIFCCFDEGKLVVLFNGFQKKTQKTPAKEIRKAAAIMKEYFEMKKGNNDEK